MLGTSYLEIEPFGDTLLGIRVIHMFMYNKKCSTKIVDCDTFIRSVLPIKIYPGFFVFRHSPVRYI